MCVRIDAHGRHTICVPYWLVGKCVYACAETECVYPPLHSVHQHRNRGRQSKIILRTGFHSKLPQNVVFIFVRCNTVQRDLNAHKIGVKHFQTVQHNIYCETLGESIYGDGEMTLCNYDSKGCQRPQFSEFLLESTFSILKKSKFTHLCAHRVRVKMGCYKDNV